MNAPTDPTNNAQLADALINSAIVNFRYYMELAERAVAQLSDTHLHQALDENTNCIAVIMKHVAGNLRSRWTDFLTSDGEKPWRNRDDEFVDTFTSREELMQHWDQGWGCLLASLESLQPGDLAKTITIRGESHTVPLAIERSLAHCAYHVGQIVLIARVLARDNWQVLTIPPGQSAQHNQQSWGGPQYAEREKEEGSE